MMSVVTVVRLQRSSFRTGIKMAEDDETKKQQARYERWVSIKEQYFNTDVKATSLANTALKSAIILNGGSAIALLAFIANQWNAHIGLRSTLQPIATALNELLYGVFSAVVATGVGYLSTFIESLHFDAYLKGKKYADRYVLVANCFIYVAIALVIHSYVRFAIAMSIVSDVFGG